MKSSIPVFTILALCCALSINTPRVGATPVTGGLSLWLDASDGATVIDDGLGGVERWEDKSGLGNHATQSVDVERPILSPGAMNGQDAIRFDGLDDGLSIAESLIVNYAYTMFIVDQYHGPIQNRTLQSRDANVNWLFGLWGGLHAHYAGGWVSDPAGGAVGAPASPAGPNYAGTNVAWLSEATRNTNAPVSLYFANGGDRTINAGPSLLPGHLGLMGEGAFPLEVSTADVAELLVYNRTLSAHERAVVGSQLADKYGIAHNYSVNRGTRVSTFTGAGAGLDLQGTFLHAVDANGAGGFAIGDANFTSDAGIVVAENAIPAGSWVNPDFGATPDDDNLETVMKSIRWTNTADGGIGDIGISLPNLTVGNTYKLQLLFSDVGDNRHFQARMNGNVLRRDLHSGATGGGPRNHTNLGVVLTHEFVATSNGLDISLDGNGLGGGDINPIINGVTLEDMGAATSTTTIGQFTSADAGGGLDMQGDFVHAVNARGPGNLQVGDALFTSDGGVNQDGSVNTGPPGVKTYSEHDILAWGPPRDFGNTPSNDNLETVMQSIRWTSTIDNGDILSVDLADLTPGQQYKLQLLFAEGCACQRGFDVAVDGITIADDFSPLAVMGGSELGNLGVVITHEFFAGDDTLNIVLDGYAAGFIDPNPALQGLTLERVPEPASGLLLLLGLVGLLPARRKRR